MTTTPEISAYMASIARRNAGKHRRISPTTAQARRENLARQRAKKERGAWYTIDGQPYTGPTAHLSIKAGRTGVYQLGEADQLVTWKDNQ